MTLSVTEKLFSSSKKDSIYVSLLQPLLHNVKLSTTDDVVFETSSLKVILHVAELLSMKDPFDNV